ncbi:TIGR04222 domain-containing membrane protein [Umezawaea beigongshangensis]|uniref:TIGR04222 domain-containing membrane protein n=1 Tax=Umezawaea beigongshangensis TaxID=2780383 RepID=UPI0018F26963|nr:TIGR04222 domain-containing membrane protein [Umezawaea beigongshangensis]
MERPWGLTGPEFLNIYAIALCGAVAFALVVRALTRSGRGAADVAQRLTLDELAHLAGGPRRVLEASVARLVDAEVLRPSRGGTVQVVKGATAANPVDQVVVADARQHSRRTLGLMISALADHRVLDDLRDRLVSLGLLVDPALARSRARLSALPVAVLIVVGVARWINGLRIDAPVGWLSLQLVLSAVLLALLLRSKKHQLTRRGTRLLAEVRAPGTTRIGDGTLALGGAAGLVALGGLTAYPDLAVRSALVAQSARGGWSSCSGSSGYVATGSSCSSGSSASSCGGGGGGCGGGSS